VELDGEGTCLTTESCLLNDNRNPGRSRAAMEAVLSETLSVEKVIWLLEGLLGDHTDGHIDNIARFAAPGVVLHMLPTTDDDPNRGVLHRIADVLREARDARGRELQRVVVPSPGHVTGDDGNIQAASYLNFYVGNRTVVVPAFGQPNDERARKAIESAFPERRVVLSSARKLLEGGGTLHCITRELPEAAARQTNGASG
jgi:agmatine deiminase